MTDKRKRELEIKLNAIVAELREIVEEMHYGVSLMVLPDGDGSSVSAFIHECSGDYGIIGPLCSFEGALGAEFDHDDDVDEGEI
jgi:hypothetical protein